MPLINIDITHNHVHDRVTDSRGLLYETEIDKNCRIKAYSSKIIRAKNLYFFRNLNKNLSNSYWELLLKNNFCERKIRINQNLVKFFKNLWHFL